MKFKQFNEAIDAVMEMTKCDDDTAIETVSKICEIFELKAEESANEMYDMFINFFGKVLGSEE